MLKSANFCAKNSLGKLQFSWLYFYIYWRDSAYALDFNFLWDLADDNIWLARKILRIKTWNRFKNIFLLRSSDLVIEKKIIF